MREKQANKVSQQLSKNVVNPDVQGGDVTPHRVFFQNFVKGIHCDTVTFSITSFFPAEMLMWQLFLRVISHCHSDRNLTCRSSQIRLF